LELYSGFMQTDFLSLTNGSRGRLSFDGGTLIARGGMISNGLALCVGASGFPTPPATLVVASNQPFVVNGDLILGSNVPSSQLFLTNGGTLRSLGLAGYSGYTAQGSNTLVVVANPNSVWTNAGFLSIGSAGSFSQLV